MSEDRKIASRILGRKLKIENKFIGINDDEDEEIVEILDGNIEIATQSGSDVQSDQENEESNSNKIKDNIEEVNNDASINHEDMSANDEIEVNFANEVENEPMEIEFGGLTDNSEKQDNNEIIDLEDFIINLDDDKPQLDNNDLNISEEPQIDLSEFEDSNTDSIEETADVTEVANINNEQLSIDEDNLVDELSLDNDEDLDLDFITDNNISEEILLDFTSTSETENEEVIKEDISLDELKLEIEADNDNIQLNLEHNQSNDLDDFDFTDEVDKDIEEIIAEDLSSYDIKQKVADENETLDFDDFAMNFEDNITDINLPQESLSLQPTEESDFNLDITDITDESSDQTTEIEVKGESIPDDIIINIEAEDVEETIDFELLEESKHDEEIINLEDGPSFEADDLDIQETDNIDIEDEDTLLENDIMQENLQNQVDDVRYQIISEQDLVSNDEINQYFAGMLDEDKKEYVYEALRNIEMQYIFEEYINNFEFKDFSRVKYSIDGKVIYNSLVLTNEILTRTYVALNKLEELELPKGESSFILCGDLELEFDKYIDEIRISKLNCENVYLVVLKGTVVYEEAIEYLGRYGVSVIQIDKSISAINKNLENLMKN